MSFKEQMRELRRLRRRLSETARAIEDSDQRVRGGRVADMVLRIEANRGGWLDSQTPAPTKDMSFREWHERRLVTVRKDYEDPILAEAIRVAADLDLLAGAAYFVAQGGGSPETDVVLRDVSATYEKLRLQLDALVGRSEEPLLQAAYEIEGSSATDNALSDPVADTTVFDTTPYRGSIPPTLPRREEGSSSPERSTYEDAGPETQRRRRVKWLHLAATALGAVGSIAAYFSESAPWLVVAAAGAVFGITASTLDLASEPAQSSKRRKARPTPPTQLRVELPDESSEDEQPFDSEPRERHSQERDE